MKRRLLVLFSLVACAVAIGADHVDVGPAVTSIVDRFREGVVLLSADAADPRQDAISVVGQVISEQNAEAEDALRDALVDDLRQSGKTDFARRPALVAQFLDDLEREKTLHDADLLAFVEPVDTLADIVDEAPSGKADAWRRRLDDDRAKIGAISARYRDEARPLLTHAGGRGLSTPTREAWNAYVAFARTTHSVDAVLATYAGDTSALGTGGRGTGRHDTAMEIYGFDLPDHTFVLSFDDGPDARYTPKILDTLEQYGDKAIFFELGNHVGVDTKGDVTLASGAALTKEILADGHLVGNHTVSHPNLPKLPDDQIGPQIDDAAAILQKAAGLPMTLFRPPYGARDDRVFAALTARGLRAFIWDVDSRDWADPVAESIAANTLQQVDTMRRGVILMHDIHPQTVDALPLVLDGLKSRGISVVLWDGKQVVGAPVVAENKPAPVTLYDKSWAVVIGVDAYQHWPKLAYADTDAKGVRDELVNKYGFPPENVTLLLDGDATRQNIVAVLGDQLPRKVGPNDRVFVFYAGHGATRKLPDGGQKGYIVPVDADTTNFYSQAISMSAVDDIDEALAAKHVLFVMDACYSGIALTRGGAAADAAGDPERYLKELAKRPARQILTAGGADEEVSDYGPGQHSIFTWTLLQGLDGQADLNGDGVIVASELASFVGPRVSALSHQTPEFGNLTGSAGGEFVLELGKSSELLSDETHPAGTDTVDQQKALVDARKLAAQTDTLMQELADMEARLEALAGGRGQGASDAVAEAARYDAWGLEQYHDGKFAEALSAFQHASELDPTNVQAVNNVGYVFLKLERYPDAVTWLDKTVALDPQRAVAWLNLGDACTGASRPDQARDAYAKYVALVPTGHEADRARKALPGVP